MDVSTLDEEQFNLEIRKFLKKVGINSQREIERAVHEGLESGRLKAGDRLRTKMTLEIVGLDMHHAIEGEIALA